MRFSIRITVIRFVLAGVIAVCHKAEGTQIDMKFDSFGGNTVINGGTTGFFHLEEIDGRHFLVTPVGNGCRALGINHFHNMTSKDYDGATRNIREWGFNVGCYQCPKWMW